MKPLHESVSSEKGVAPLQDQCRKTDLIELKCMVEDYLRSAADELTSYHMAMHLSCQQKAELRNCILRPYWPAKISECGTSGL
jgi:hypothetical protein